MVRGSTLISYDFFEDVAVSESGVEGNFDKVVEFFTVSLPNLMQDAVKRLVVFQFEHLVSQLKIRMDRGNFLRMTKADVDSASHDWPSHLEAIMRINEAIRQKSTQI